MTNPRNFAIVSFFSLTNSMLDVSGLCFDYQQQPLLAQVYFALDWGQILHIRGINGSGKTTLLRLLAGILTPHAGDIILDGRSIYKDMLQYQQSICYLGHKIGISSNLTVRENCYFDPHCHQTRSSLDPLLEKFNVMKFADWPAGLLSAGMSRRLGLIRLVMSSARLWLLDEPLVALDTHTLDLLMTLFRDHIQQGGSIVFTSHQPLPDRLLTVQELSL